MNELEDNREFKEAAAAAAKAAADMENEPSSMKGAEVESRKMSIDSGVISVGEASDGNESDKSGPEEAIIAEEEEVVVQKQQSAPNSPSGSYNLRERRGVNFAMYR